MKLFTKIRQLVKKIPPGRVATYGEIARELGIRDARIIGWALHGNRDPKTLCHRVVNRSGQIAENYSLGGWQEQKLKLLEEGIEFASKKRIDLLKYGFHFKPQRSIQTGVKTS